VNRSTSFLTAVRGLLGALALMAFALGSIAAWRGEDQHATAFLLMSIGAVLLARFRIGRATP